MRRSGSLRLGFLALVMATAVVASLAAVMVVQDREDDAAADLARARTLLETPFERAPELVDLPAAEAQAALQSAVEKGAEPGALAHDIEALLHLGRGDLIFAEGSMSAARAIDGWTPHRHVLASVIAREASRIDLANAHVDAALALDPDDARALLQKADLALDRRDGRAADNALRRLIEQASRIAALHDRRALALELLERWDDAEREARSATELQPDLHTAWINLGRVLRHQGRTDEAATAFRTALRHAPANADAILGVGLCALDQEDFDVARGRFERVRELAPHETLALIGLGDVARATGDDEGAVASYREAVRENPLDAATWVKLGNALFADEPAQAVRAFEEAVGLEPALAAAHNGLGAARMRLGDVDEAMAALGRAAELDPEDPHPVMNLALLHEQRGDTRAARESWQAALERDPNAAFARQRLARL